MTEENKKWKPRRKEKYYCVYDRSDIQIRSFLWEGSFSDILGWFLGNCFKTEEEAKELLQKIKESNFAEKDDKSAGCFGCAYNEKSYCKLLAGGTVSDFDKNFGVFPIRCPINKIKLLNKNVVLYIENTKQICGCGEYLFTEYQFEQFECQNCKNVFTKEKRK